MLEKPVILITGASSGIGAATARLFAQQGYRLVLAARRLERLQALANEIQAAGGEALAHPVDVCQSTQVETLVRSSLEAFGQINLLFNNAGFGRLDWLENLEAESDVAAQIETNLSGSIYMARAVLPHMIARRQGQIINMASMAAYIATPTYSVYAASKFGVRGFTDALRREVGVHRIRVSLICPGGVETEFGEIAGFGRSTQVVSPKLFELSAEEVARGVLSLAQRPRRELIMPWMLKWAMWLNVLMPGVFDWALERMYVSQRAGVRKL